MKKIILIFLPLLALACGFSRSALLVTLPTLQPIPSSTITQTEIMPQATRTHTCTVTAETLHLRESPGLEGIVIDWLKAGDILTILDDQPKGNWIRVRLGDLTGWINSNYCTEAP
jgi:uncharacterized protein YgiM (DUF1202 family)